MIIDIDVLGDEKVIRTLEGIAMWTANLAPAFALVDRLWEREQASWFRTDGGGTWPPLAESTVAQKAKYGYPPDTLVRTERLRDSLTRHTSDSIRAMGPSTFVFGTTVPYAFYHQYGTAKMPARRPLIDSVILEAEASAILSAYAMGGGGSGSLGPKYMPPGSPTWVSGYTRKSGVRVKGYFRMPRTR